jgi:ATP-binding protein involved in chromosome partitioning
MPLKMYKAQELQKPKIKWVIAIAAGKGGVGKSTITVNLGLALKKLGYVIGILDSDLYGPSLRKMLPEDDFPMQDGVKIVPAVCCGIKMISMAYFKLDGQASAVRAPIANRMIGQFIQQVEWGDLDFLLIDFPPGTGDIQMTLAQQANITCALMVTTPQEVAVMDVKRAMHFFKQVKIPVLGIVENMSYYRYPATGEKIYLFGKGGGSQLSRYSGAPLLECIPLDAEVSSAGDQGYSLIDKHPQALSSAAFMELAKNFLSRLDKKPAGENCVDLVWKEMLS